MSNYKDITKYTELATVLQQTKEKEIENYQLLRKYLEKVGSNYSHLIGIIQKFKCEYLPKSDKASISPKFSPKYEPEYATEVGKCFSKLASTYLMEEDSLRTILEQINGPIMSKLDSDLSHYDQDFNNLMKQFKENLEAPKKLIKSYNAKHQKYFEAGDKVKEMINSKKSSSAIKKAKAEFISAKKAAINEYNELRVSIAKYSGEIERILTSFEDLEKKRAINMQILLNLISTELLDNASTEFVQGKSFIVNEIRSAKPSKDVKILSSALHSNPPISISQTPEASDSFQLVKISPAVCSFLKPEQLFQKDCSEGRVVMKCKNDINGIGNKLRVKSGELVVVLEEITEKDEHYFKCKNINESVGLIPASFLEQL